MTKNKFLLSLVFGFSALVRGEEELPLAVATVVSEPTHFREIGSFKVTKAVLTKLGETTEVSKGDLILRVFTDGIDIRISPGRRRR